MPGLEAGINCSQSAYGGPLRPLGPRPSSTCAHSPVKFTSAQLTVCWGGGAVGEEQAGC